MNIELIGGPLDGEELPVPDLDSFARSPLVYVSSPGGEWARYEPWEGEMWFSGWVKEAPRTYLAP